MQSSEKKKDLRIVKFYLLYSILFGILMGAVFPVFASFFVHFRSDAHKMGFTAACLAAGILVGLFSFLIGRVSILRFISRMAQRMDALAEQEAELGEDIHLYSSDCIGALINAFNRFQGKLRDMIQRLQDISETSGYIGQELAANSTETSAASDRIKNQMGTIHDQSACLIQEIETVDRAQHSIHDASERVTQTIDRQSESLTSLSSLIESSANTARNISLETEKNLSQIRMVLESSQESITNVSGVSATMMNLYTDLEGIRKHLYSIDDVAEQISILGINASIEAARSGAAGKGFSIVSQEIRKLADLARNNSVAISERMESLVAQAQAGADHSKHSAERLTAFMGEIQTLTGKIETISRRLLDLSDGSQDMLNAHMELVKVSVDVTNAMMILTDGSDSIQGSIQVLVDAATNNMQSVSGALSDMKEIAEDILQLDRVSVQNDESARNLNEQIKKFKTNT